MQITEKEWISATDTFLRIQQSTFCAFEKTMLVKKLYISQNYVINIHYYYIIYTIYGFERMKNVRSISSKPLKFDYNIRTLFSIPEEDTV